MASVPYGPNRPCCPFKEGLMANRKVDMSKVRHVLLALKGGSRGRKIARLTGVSRTAVATIETRFAASGRTFEDALSLNDSDLDKLMIDVNAWGLVKD
jgi:hypothetical protein